MQLPSLYRQLPGCSQEATGWALGRGVCPGRPAAPHGSGMIPMEPKTRFFFLLVSFFLNPDTPGQRITLIPFE